MIVEIKDMDSSQATFGTVRRVFDAERVSGIGTPRIMLHREGVYDEAVDLFRYDVEILA